MPASPKHTIIGFIGLGAMGNPMARRLAQQLEPGAELVVYDIMASAMDSVIAEYPNIVKRGSSPADVANQATVVLTMVPEGSHAKTVYLDKNTGILQAKLTNALLIDCSTIETNTHLTIKKELVKKYPDVKFYDAPVTGGVSGAEKGTLAFFLGSTEEDPNLRRVIDLLGVMGTRIIPCGGPSLGLATKLTNNYLSGLIAIASAEAMNMGMRSGLNPIVLNSALAAGTAQNAICDKFNPVPGVVPEAPSSKGYVGGFKVQLMAKDFRLAMSMANDVGAKTLLGAIGAQAYHDASNDPQCRDLDSRVIFRYIGGNENWI